MSFTPAPTGETSHRSVSAIDVADGRMTVHEDDGSFAVPLTVGWTVAEPWLAASATRRADGRVAVDLAFLAGPHRLELDLDPATGTFATHWPIVPLFGAGVAGRLASMAGPAD